MFTSGDLDKRYMRILCFFCDIIYKTCIQNEEVKKLKKKNLRQGYPVSLDVLELTLQAIKN